MDSLCYNSGGEKLWNGSEHGSTRIRVGVHGRCVYTMSSPVRGPVPVQAYLVKNLLNFVPRILDNRARVSARSRRHRSCLDLKRPPSRLVFVSELWT